MNLCLTTRGLGRGVYGGLPQATGDLAQGLSQEGHSVFVVTERSSGSAPELPGVTILPTRLPELPQPFTRAPPESAADNLRYAGAVYREVCRVHEQVSPVDAVIAPMWRSEGVVCMLDDRFPTIVTCQTGLWISAGLDDSYRRLPDIGQRLSLERAGLARSRYLHGLTEAILSKTVRDFDLRPTIAAVVSRGLRDRRGAVAEQGACDDALAEQDPRVGAVEVLFVGRIEPRKGVDVLLRAADALVAEGLEVSFTVTGPERDRRIREAFEREAANRPSHRAVRFTGAVSDAERDRLLAASDIVCLPARYESHGIVLIEAMMFGKAIATCAAGGIGEVVETGRTALISPPDDAAALAASLRRLVRDPRLRAELGAAARETFKLRFDAGLVARRMEAFIERVVAAHRPSTGDVTGQLSTLIREVLATPLAECDALAAALLGRTDA